LKTVSTSKFLYVTPLRGTQTYATEGNTIYSQSKVLEMRESRTLSNVGIVTVKITGFNQDGAIAIAFKRTVMDYRRGQAPVMPDPAMTYP
jgi:hypothetical protein